jgi:hypothetical protein
MSLNTMDFKTNERVFYISNNSKNKECKPEVVNIIKIHYEDIEPYYTIKFEDSHREKQTDKYHLKKIQTTPHPLEKSGDDKHNEVREDEYVEENELVGDSKNNLYNKGRKLPYKYDSYYKYRPRYIDPYNRVIRNIFGLY